MHITNINYIEGGKKDIGYPQTESASFLSALKSAYIE